MDPIEVIRRMVAENGQSQAAKKMGISVSYLCNIMKGRADPGPLVLEALDLERVVTYRRKPRAVAQNG